MKLCPAAALCLVVLSVSVPVAPVGASPRTAKQLERRGEARGIVEGLLAGADLDAGVARLKFLGEEGYAAQALASFANAPDELHRRIAAQALAGLAVPASEPALVSLVRDPDGTTRMNALRGLRFLHSRNLRVLLPLLRDKTLGVRREAALAIGAAGLPAAGKPLVEAAQSEPETDVRALMVVAAGQSGDVRQRGALEAFLRSSSESTRAAATRALCMLASPVGLRLVRKLLASPDRDVRRDGISLLEGVPSKISEPLLLPLLRDPDPATAARTARLLYQGGDASMVDWLVIASERARSGDKLLYENELDALHLSDEQRRSILEKAGLR